jgi:hypothetical protein
MVRSASALGLVGQTALMVRREEAEINDGRGRWLSCPETTEGAVRESVSDLHTYLHARPNLPRLDCDPLPGASPSRPPGNPCRQRRGGGGVARPATEALRTPAPDPSRHPRIPGDDGAGRRVEDQRTARLSGGVTFAPVNTGIERCSDPTYIVMVRNVTATLFAIAELRPGRI